MIKVSLVSVSEAISGFLRFVLLNRGILVGNGPEPSGVSGRRVVLVVVQGQDPHAWGQALHLRKSGIPVIVSTRPTHASVRRAVDMGAAFMPYPFNIEGLVGTVRQMAAA